MNEALISQIRAADLKDIEKLREGNKIFHMSKMAHYNKVSQCCHKRNTRLLEGSFIDQYAPKSGTDKQIQTKIIGFEEDEKNLNEEKIKLKKFCFNACDIQENKYFGNNLINYYLIEKYNNPNLKINHVRFDDKPIDIDYNSTTELSVISKERFSRLRNPRYLDEELKEKEFKGDPFGNPFKRCKEDFENSLQTMNESFIDIENADNLNIKISEEEKNAFVENLNRSVTQRKENDDLTLMNFKMNNKKRSRSAGNIDNKPNPNFILYDLSFLTGEHKLAINSPTKPNKCLIKAFNNKEDAIEDISKYIYAI